VDAGGRGGFARCLDVEGAAEGRGEGEKGYTMFRRKGKSCDVENSRER